MASAAEQMAANTSWSAFGQAKELRQRILFTLGLLIVYRIGTYIPVPGIDADCGGSCACGTCHCFIEEAWIEASGEADPIEEAMLGMRPDRTEGSRLSCQIEVTDDMNGMVVRLPEYQM